jgi:hypothetical protein
LKDRNTRYETPIGPSGVPITAVVVLLCDECAIKEYIPLAYEVRRIKQFSNKKTERRGTRWRLHKASATQKRAFKTLL